MRFVLELDLDEPAFAGDHPRLEIRRLLHRVGNNLVDPDVWASQNEAYVSDRDGNHVGEWRIEQ